MLRMCIEQAFMTFILFVHVCHSSNIEVLAVQQEPRKFPKKLIGKVLLALIYLNRDFSSQNMQLLEFIQRRFLLHVC
jgi:hypothetical protein